MASKRHKHHKNHYRNSTEKRVQRDNTNLDTHNNKKIQIDVAYILMIFKYYIDRGLLTSKDFIHYARNPNSPKYEFVNKISKGELRQIWLWQMRHGDLFCEICGHKITTMKNGTPTSLTAEHRIPKSKGGKTNVTNLGPAHAKCNSLKTNHMPDKWAKIGYDILRRYKINIDFEKCRYQYERSK